MRARFRSRLTRWTGDGHGRMAEPKSSDKHLFEGGRRFVVPPMCKGDGLMESFVRKRGRLYVFRLFSIDGRSTQQHWYAPRIDGMGERESGHVLSAGLTCKMILL